MNTHLIPKPTWLNDIPSHIKVVGEVKMCSPSGYISRYGKRRQLDSLLAWADVISIHTHELWGGSWGWLEEACERAAEAKKPVLAKGFHPHVWDVRRAFEAGATYVLTVGWWYPHTRVWHEVERLVDVHQSEATVTVFNARNPRTGDLRGRPRCSPKDLLMEKETLYCQASLISSASDVDPKADYVLIGEALWRDAG